MNGARMSLTSAWKRIENWLGQNWSGDKQLPAGATELEIDELEAIVGTKMPANFANSMKLHNGTGDIPLFAFDKWHLPFPLLSLGSIVANWKLIQRGLAKGYFSGPGFKNRPRGPIKRAWFHERWIPIVNNWNGDYLLMDLAPEKGGRRGQVIHFSRDRGANRVLANGVSELLAKTVVSLEKGQYAYDGKRETLVWVG